MTPFAIGTEIKCKDAGTVFYVTKSDDLYTYYASKGKGIGITGEIATDLLEDQFYICGAAPQVPVASSAKDPAPRKHFHYFRDVQRLSVIDIYRVLDLFEVTDQAAGHAIKKLMCAGRRGAKDARKDIQEAIDTLNRRIEMFDEDAK